MSKPELKHPDPDKEPQFDPENGETNHPLSRRDRYWGWALALLAAGVWGLALYEVLLHLKEG